MGANVGLVYIHIKNLRLIRLVLWKFEAPKGRDRTGTPIRSQSKLWPLLGSFIRIWQVRPTISFWVHL